MKITYLHQYFNTPGMSGSTRSFEMARRLVAAGHEVNMITSWREQVDSAGWFSTVEDGVHVNWLPVRYSNYMTYADRIRAFVEFARKSASKAASLEADVIFATSTPLTIAIPAVYAARRLGVPMVFEVRDLWPEVPIAMGAIRNPLLKFALRRFECFAYKSSEAVVALSPGMADGILSTGYPRESVHVIPNSSDIDLFRPDVDARRKFRAQNGLSEDCFLLTYAGTLGRVNNVDYLVRLAHEVRGRRDIVFMTVGDGSEYSAVKGLADTLGVLGVNFFMLPKVRKNEMPGILAASDFAVSTVLPIRELEANSANKFFDGIAAGCCMLINHGGWQEDLLLQSGAGFRLSRQIDRAAEELISLVAQPEQIDAAKYKARKLAEEKFSRDDLAARLERVLSAAVAGA